MHRPHQALGRSIAERALRDAVELFTLSAESGAEDEYGQVETPAAPVLLWEGKGSIKELAEEVERTAGGDESKIGQGTLKLPLDASVQPDDIRFTVVRDTDGRSFSGSIVRVQTGRFLINCIVRID